MGDDRGSVYEDHDGRYVFRASALGGCMSSLVRHGMGMTPEPFPASMYDRFEEGNVAEPVMLGWLNSPSGGWKVWDENDLEVFVGQHNGRMQYLEDDGDGKAQAEFDIPVGSKGLIRVHPDGIGTCFLLTPEAKKNHPGLETGVQAVLEAKAFGPDFYKKFKREGIDGFSYYKYQVSVEMAATGMPCVFIVGQKDEDGIIKPDKIEWELITEPPIPLPKLKVRVMKAIAAIEAGEIPPCDQKMYPCGFWRDHDTESETSVWFKEPVSMLTADNSKVDVVQVDKWATVYDEVLEAEKKLKVTKAEAVKELCKLFDEAGARGATVNCGGLTVEDYIGEAKGRVDYKRLFKDKGITEEEADAYRSETKIMRYPKVKRNG